MTEVLQREVGRAKLDIAYERLGQPGDPPVLLIMGLAAQLVSWPDGFINALLGKNLQVVRFDNRDAGHSTHCTDAPPPNLQAVLAGDLSSVSYTLADMAADAAGLLEALGIGAAHVVGASMGGAIAQHMALDYSDHVLSLTCMMTSTGASDVGQMDPETQRALFGGPPVLTREEAIERALRTAPLVRSPVFPTTPEDIAARVGLAWDRDHDAPSVARQGIATIASGDRTSRLAKLRIPTLVIHGTHDRMCHISGGRAIAAAVPGARMVAIEGMAHDLPPALWEDLARHIADHVHGIA